MTIWTEARVTLLTQLWNDGLTAAVIAGHLGVTRNAVLGKKDRLKLSDRLREPSSGQRRPAPKRLYARRYPAIRYRDPPTVVVATAARSVPCSLLELNDDRCRWPVGDPGNADFHFCGGTVERGPYCGFHGRIAYQAPAKRRDKKPFVMRSAA